MDRISFVILHFGDLQVTDRCIRSIQRMDQQERIRIVVVDNETEKSAEERLLLRQKYSSDETIDVIQIRENGGFSYANNRGYLYARTVQNASFILVLNNDIEFLQKDFIERMEQAYDKNPCHILGPDIIRTVTKERQSVRTAKGVVQEHQNPMDIRIRTAQEADYTIRMNQFALRWYPILYPVLYLQNQYEEKKRRHQKSRNEAYYHNVQKEIVPFGACLIFTPDFVWDEYRAFEPETEFYYEEYILALRCRRKGYKVVYDPDMKVMHENGSATKGSFSARRSRMRFRMEKTLQSCQIYKNYLEEC